MAITTATFIKCTTINTTNSGTGANIYRRNQLKSLPPLFITSNPNHINTQHLTDLYAAANHSCHRFPAVDSDGRVKPVNVKKLRVAISYSSVVVSVFCRTNDSENSLFRLKDLLPVREFNGELVGFGRAVSDNSLTASIYDVMVTPSLQGMGIGKMIVKRIIRMLTRRDIYDIAALCSENERMFFKACGFGDDILGSTTMMYTRTGSDCISGDRKITCAGRSLLLVPSRREPFTRINTE